MDLGARGSEKVCTAGDVEVEDTGAGCRRRDSLLPLADASTQNLLSSNSRISTELDFNALSGQMSGKRCTLLHAAK